MTVAEVQRIRRRNLLSQSTVIGVCLVAFSAFYFADIFLRASEKYFWYDELFTLSFSRFATFHTLWTALVSGVDFNPPLFYLVTHVSERLFGAGLIGLRAPEILGFWIFSLCLYRAVSRRAGPVAGFAAMLLPMLTGAYYYAYEARPHAIVLGCCGVALICWQMAIEPPWPKRWLVGFSVSLLAAFMMHCYALAILVPFIVAELYRTFELKRIEWKMWVAMAVPAVLACFVYLPLLLSFRKANDATSFNTLFSPSWVQIQHFYLSLLSHCVVILVVAATLLAAEIVLAPRIFGSARTEYLPLNPAEVVLGFGFLAIPLFGIVLGKLIHGPFFARYFLSALAGICFLIGMGIGRSRKPFAAALLLALAGMLGAEFAALGLHRLHGEGEFLPEPSTKLTLNTAPGKPLYLHSVLTANAGGSYPIGVLNSLEFFYLVHYAPALRSRLYLVTPSRKSLEYGGALSFLPWCMDKYNPPASYQDFARLPEFLLYGDEGHFTQIPKLIRAGAQIEWVKAGEDHFLADMRGLGSPAVH